MFSFDRGYRTDTYAAVIQTPFRALLGTLLFTRKETSSLHDVFRATILAKIRYCALARSGLCSASDRAKLDAFLRRSKKYGYCADDVPTTATELFSTADQSLFKRVLSNEHHVLQPLLPDKTINRYKLRPRNPDRQ